MTFKPKWQRKWRTGQIEARSVIHFLHAKGNTPTQIHRQKDVKMKVFWDIVLCSLTGENRCFRGAYCLHPYIALMMEAVCTSEM
jgi:hypothetical protein